MTFAFALMALGLTVTLLPTRWDVIALGELRGADGAGYVPTLCFLTGDICLAGATWAALAAARGRPIERLAVAVVGLITAALTGDCVRRLLQIVLLRQFYRPLLLFSSPARAAAVGWGALLTLVLAGSFIVSAAVAVANLVPAPLARALKPIRWLAGRHRWLLVPFGALALTVIVTQWFLSASLANAMGYSFPLPSGIAEPVSLRVLAESAWDSMQILVPLPLLVFMWEGVEASRTCHRVARKPDGTTTKVLTRLQRIDYRLPAGVVIVSAVVFAAAEGSWLAMIDGIALLAIMMLSFTGMLGGAASLSGSIERWVNRLQLPEEWRDLGPVTLPLVLLLLPVLYILGGDIFLGAKDALWFPSDASNFYSYWHSYGLIPIPSVSTSGIYGHTESVVWGTGLGIAVVLIVGILITRSSLGGPVIAFCLRVAAFAFLLAPLARLADHSYATFLLTACVVACVVLIFKGRAQPDAVWSVVAAGGLLSLWSFVLWRTEWLPAAVMLCLTIFQRFIYNAGSLNDENRYRANRIAYFQAIALAAVAVLALGHGAAPGYFESDALSSIADRIAMSLVAAIWLVMLVSRQGPAIAPASGAADWRSGQVTVPPPAGTANPSSATGMSHKLSKHYEGPRVLAVTGPSAVLAPSQGQWQNDGWLACDAIIRRAALTLDETSTRTHIEQASRFIFGAPSDPSVLWLKVKNSHTWAVALGTVQPDGKVAADWTVEVALVPGQVEVTTPQYLAVGDSIKNGNLRDRLQAAALSGFANGVAGPADHEAEISTASLEPTPLISMTQLLGRGDHEFTIRTSKPAEFVRQLITHEMGFPLLKSGQDTWRFGLGLPISWPANSAELELRDPGSHRELVAKATVSATGPATQRLMVSRAGNVFYTRLKTLISHEDPAIMVTPAKFTARK
ncbi:MAG: hypothetical protein ACLQDY_26745 [Streptosporangiaceae bacterium]